MPNTRSTKMRGFVV